MNDTQRADYYRQRGGQVQPDSLEPNQVIDDRPFGGNQEASPETAARRVESAAGYAALVYRRLMAADREMDANDLDAHFVRVFGEDYVNARFRVIQDAGDDTTEDGEGQSEEFDESEYQ